MIGHTGKNISTAVAPNGDLYSFWNDYYATMPASIVLKDISDATLFTFTKTETSQYRCLLYQKHYANSSSTSAIYPILFNDTTDLSASVIYPLYECLNPQVYFNNAKGGAVLTFWSNMTSDYDETTKVYDRTKVIKFEEDKLDNPTVPASFKRCLFSAPLIFNQYAIGSLSTIDVFPICLKPHLVYFKTDTNPVTDFSLGGGGSTLAYIDSSAGGGIYNVTLYANGQDAPATGSAQVFVLNMYIGETLPTGTWILVSTTKMLVAGG